MNQFQPRNHKTTLTNLAVKQPWHFYVTNQLYWRGRGINTSQESHKMTLILETMISAMSTEFCANSISSFLWHNGFSNNLHEAAEYKLIQLLKLKRLLEFKMPPIIYKIGIWKYLMSQGKEGQNWHPYGQEVLTSLLDKLGIHIWIK